MHDSFSITALRHVFGQFRQSIVQAPVYSLGWHGQSLSYLDLLGIVEIARPQNGLIFGIQPLQRLIHDFGGFGHQDMRFRRPPRRIFTILRFRER